MTTSTSYLQTLAKDEAIAFATSLQAVKNHLSQELQWMNEEIEQKTVQLQGIEILLSKATTELGLLNPDALSVSEPAIVEDDLSTPIDASTVKS